MSDRIRFFLNLTADRYLSHYQGHAKNVSVIAEDGRRIEFPANSLRPFVTKSGVQGRFELLIDDNNRLQRLDRLNN
ncbi:MAG: DUF2835 domain-containing protein [gamma proteobacterium endosymbiont of Lamellibrachia anaximandri]|nr:DUF2835 domain-containing protein [gamma proteobacterium endosymbiont of Lamellibrachia anaximandri]